MNTVRVGHMGRMPHPQPSVLADPGQSLRARRAESLHRAAVARLEPREARPADATAQLDGVYRCQHQALGVPRSRWSYYRRNAQGPMA